MEAGSGGVMMEASSVLSGVVELLPTRDSALSPKVTPPGMHFVPSCTTEFPSLLLFFCLVYVAALFLRFLL